MQLRVKIAAAVAAPALAVPLIAGPALAGYGNGNITWGEFMDVRVGMSRGHIANLCSCSGTMYDSNGTDGQYSMRYDDWMSGGGYVHITYQISAPDFAVGEWEVEPDGTKLYNPDF